MNTIVAKVVEWLLNEKGKPRDPEYGMKARNVTATHPEYGIKARDGVSADTLKKKNRSGKISKKGEKTEKRT